MRFVSGGVCRLVRIDPDDDHGVRVSPQERPHRRLSSEVSLERVSGVAGWFSLGDFLVVFRAAGCRSRSSVAGLHSGTAPLAHHDRRRNPNRTSDFGGSDTSRQIERQPHPWASLAGVGALLKFAPFRWRHRGPGRGLRWNVTDFVEMFRHLRARQSRPFDDANHHSDAGSQAIHRNTFHGDADAGGDQTVGRDRRRCFDNGLAQTTIGRSKTECLRDGSPLRSGPLRTLADLEHLTSAWVSWYHETRLMHRLGRRPPAEVEAEYYVHLQVGQHTDHT